MKRDFQIAFLKAQGLQPTHSLLDIGCGTLRGGIPIIAYLDAGHYAGIEARAEVLHQARKELQENELEHKRPELIYSTDLASLDVHRSFDFVWAFSVLIHLSDSKLNDCLGLVARSLSADGVFFANVNMGAGTDGEWQGFPVVHRPMSFYHDRCAAVALSVRDIGSLRSLGHLSGVTAQDEQRMLAIQHKP